VTQVLAHTIADAVKVTGIGRTTLYELIGAKKLDARKAGNRTLITADSLRNYIASTARRKWRPHVRLVQAARGLPVLVQRNGLARV
jgi:excisionase family DNA binding protein